MTRRYIPLCIREMVLDQQMDAAGFTPSWAARQGPTYKRLEMKLREFFDCVPVELHHRPALCNRERDGDDYIPRANDPAFLTYLPVDDHDIETRVRGQHGQYSDLALRRKRKRIERKKTRPKRKWPKRSFR